MFWQMVRLGMKNSTRARRTLALTVISVAIAVSLLYSSLSASYALQSSANTFLKSATSPLDIRVASTRYFEPLSSEVRVYLSTLREVKRVFPRIEEHAQLDNVTSNVFVLLVALDPVEEQDVGALVADEGVVDLSRNGCFLTREASRILEKSVGDRLALHTSAGLASFNVTGTGTAVDKGVYMPAVFVSIQMAWDIYRIKYSGNATNRVYLEVHDLFCADGLATTLTQTLGHGYVATSLKTYQARTMATFLEQGRLILMSLVLSAVLVSVFRVLSSFASLFDQRRFELGILLAFGASRTQIAAVLMSEVMVVGATGAILGCLVGVGLGYVIFTVLTLILRVSVIQTPEMSSAFSVDVASLAASATAGIVLTLLAGSIPALRSARAPVVESLRASPLRSQPITLIPPRIRQAVVRMVWCLVVVALGAVLIQAISDITGMRLILSDLLRVMSVPVFLMAVATLSPRLSTVKRLVSLLSHGSAQVVRYLSVRNLRANLLVSAVIFNLFAASTTLLMLSSNVSDVIVASWHGRVEGQVNAANIIALIQPPKPVSVVEDVAALPHVSAACGVNQVVDNIVSGWRSVLGLVVGVQTTHFGQLSAVSLLRSVNITRGFGILDDPSSCVVSEYLAKTYDLELGSSVRTASGAELTVVGVCTSAVPIYVVAAIYESVVIVGPSTWAQTYGDGRFDVSSVIVHSANTTDTMGRLEEMHGVTPVLVSRITANYAAALLMVRTVVDASVGMIVISTVASVLVTSLSTVAARRREIGMLMAMGVSEAEIAREITLEHCTAMIPGCTAGIVVGIGCQLSMSDILARFGGQPFLFSAVHILPLLAIALGVSAIASYYGARMTCRRTVVSLLSLVSGGRT